jgi:hypothetical protein
MPGTDIASDNSQGSIFDKSIKVSILPQKSIHHVEWKERLFFFAGYLRKNFESIYNNEMWNSWRWELNYYAKYFERCFRFSWLWLKLLYLSTKLRDVTSQNPPHTHYYHRLCKDIYKQLKQDIKLY